MNKSTIIALVLFVGIFSMIIPTTVNAQIFPVSTQKGQTYLQNEIPTIQQYQQQGYNINPNYMTWEQFLQFMKYYADTFGIDYVKKVYKEYHNDDDDDDDNDDHKDHKKHKWWKDRDNWWKDNDNDKKKKKWWEKEKAAREDHRCEEPGTPNCGGNDDDREDPEGYDDDGDKLEVINGDYDGEDDNDSTSSNNRDNDDNDNDNEDEEESEDDDNSDNDDSDDSDDGGDDSSDEGDEE